ncbi:hypothetical protein [Maridesulfovibrio sp.]|uniref:hypothetical protein n=1 Tax=Maridesulfovibrio sp. TaxID=2795000 RepID=UPI003B0059DA
MRVTSLLFLLLLIGVPAFANDLAGHEVPGQYLGEDLLIKVATTTNSTQKFSVAESTNATNGTADSNATYSGAIAAFMNDSNSTEESQEQEPTESTANATAGTEKTVAQQPANIATTIAAPAVTISDVNYIRNLIEYKKLQVALAKQNKELIELTTPVLPAVMPKTKASSKRRCNPAWPKVVSIQGVDGRLSATLSSSAGLETVQVGDKAGPGKIVSITPRKVLARANGKNIALKFKE